MFGFCNECRDIVKYRVETREGISEVKGEEVKYIQKLAICDKCNKEIFISEIMDENLIAIDKAYRLEKELITIREIEEILEKYDIGKKPLSTLLGWSEVTITRYIDGQLPSKQYSDELYRLLKNPLHMKDTLERNRGNITGSAYRKVDEKLKNINKLSKEDLKSLSKIEIISKYIIELTGDITPLALQKLLYYVQGFYSAFMGEYIFKEDCEAWVHGPVYSKIYYKYKDYRYHPLDKHSIDLTIFEGLLTEDEINIINSVINSFGRYSGKILEEMTHCEDPWKDTRSGLDLRGRSNRVIEKNSIKEYFENIVNFYEMNSVVDIEDYTRYMSDKTFI